MFVIFDLDGTLANCEHRMHHIAEFDLDCGHAGKIDWEAFYRACVHDTPMRATINTMIAFCATGCRVEIWTGRSDLVRDETVAWLNQHGVPRCFMRMRPHGDHQPDINLKRTWLQELGRTPDLVFEDRTRVVAMWRAHGIPCFQVDSGDF